MESHHYLILGRMIFNAILGWNNTATIGTIVSYCLYWILIAAYLIYTFLKQRRQAITKAEHGEFYKEDADLVLEDARQYVNEDGVITGQDEKLATDEVIPVADSKV